MNPKGELISELCFTVCANLTKLLNLIVLSVEFLYIFLIALNFIDKSQLDYYCGREDLYLLAHEIMVLGRLSN